MTGEAEALKNEGNARKAAGDLAGAIDDYRRALEVAPDYVAALYNLGLALRERGEFTEAEDCFRRVVEVDARDVDALFNLAALRRRRLDFAGAAETYRRALEISPDNAHLWLMRGEAGVARYTNESVREAAECFRRAIELEPGLADAHYHLAQVREFDGAHGEALHGYEQALRLDPGNVQYRTALLAVKQRVCDWAGLDKLWAETRRTLAEHPEQLIDPFVVLTIPSTRAELLRCAERNARSIVERVRPDAQQLKFRFDRPAARRRRIGYLSAEFHEHATAYLAAELFELHDRSRFEVIAYSHGPEDQSAIRGRLKRAFDRFVDLRQHSDADAARAIHADGIDILVDLKGYTFRARPGILALRPAPVQVSYLGYPGTMGAEFIDYLVGDRIVTPAEDAAGYSEKLVRLPGCYQVNDRKRPVGKAPARQELGLPEGAVAFCCFNQSYKILPPTFDAWMRILAGAPGSVLWLLEWDPQVPGNLRREAARRGIDPARLIFAPLLGHRQHLDRLAAADLLLDTLPYNAHTVASDALWCGVPVLTCPGETFASRVAASQLTAVGMPELIASSMAEYEEIAVRLAREPAQLAALRAKLAAGRDTCALFDTPAFTRALERAFERMWEVHVAGLVPQDIEP